MKTLASRAALGMADLAQTESAEAQNPVARDDMQTLASRAALGMADLAQTGIRGSAESGRANPAGGAWRPRSGLVPGAYPVPLACDRLRAPTAPGDGMAGHSGRAIVAEIRLLGATPRVRVIEAHHGPATLRHLFATVVADENRLSCHRFLLRVRILYGSHPRKQRCKAQAYSIALIYAPIHE
jgi:hypothetical protein